MRVRRFFAPLVLVVFVAPVAAAGQGQDTTAYQDAKEVFSRVGTIGTVLPLAAVAEVEPNDDASEATLVAVGDVASGTIDPAGDEDFFAIDLTTGTVLDFDVDASQFGSSLDPILSLYDSDGITLLATNDDFDGFDSRIRYTVNVDGRYFVKIVDFGTPQGGPSYTYNINFNTLVPGPGDPTTLFAEDVGNPAGIVADANGDLIVGDQQSGRVVRIDATGTITELTNNFGVPWDLDIDGFGNILVAGHNYFDAGVIRISPDGFQVNQFAIEPSSFVSTSIVVGPDGDVWVAYPFYQIIRYNPAGVEQGSIDISALDVFDMAFSPSGELHFTTDFGGSVYRVDVDTPVEVIAGSAYLEGLVFDAAGSLYVANGFLGEITLYDATYAPTSDPFAISNVSGPVHLAFGRDATGTMAARLFAGITGFGPQTAFAQGIAELNPAGIASVGLAPPNLTCTATGLRGDADGDDLSNSRDALIALTSAVGIDVSAFGFDLDNIDVDGSGEVTTRDALFLMSFGVGLSAPGSFAGAPLDASCTIAAGPQIARRP